MLDLKIQEFNFDDELNNYLDDVLDETLLKANQIMKQAVQNVDAVDYEDLQKASIVEIDKAKKAFLFYTNLNGSFKSRSDYSGLIIKGQGSSAKFGKRDFPTFASQNVKEFITDGVINSVLMSGGKNKHT